MEDARGDRFARGNRRLDHLGGAALGDAHGAEVLQLVGQLGPARVVGGQRSPAARWEWFRRPGWFTATTSRRAFEKWFWLERNRLRTVLAVYPTALLLLLAPALIAAELALLVLAGRGGWLTAKLRAQFAVLAGLPEIARRRRRVQATRSISAAAFAGRLTASLESDFVPDIGDGPIGHAQAGYWGLITGTLRLLSR